MSLTFLFAGHTHAAGRGEEPPMKATDAILFDFDSAEPWRNIDDTVMGGRSQSRMRLEDGVAIFEGVVSLENNGGFGSIRSRPTEFDLRDYQGVALRLRGDGKSYGVRLRTDASFDGVSYETKVVPEEGVWTELHLPFETFEPVFRGRSVPGHPPLDAGAIKTIGLIISDKQEGPFRLELDWIRAYGANSSGR